MLSLAMRQQRDTPAPFSSGVFLKMIEELSDAFSRWETSNILGICSKVPECFLMQILKTIENLFSVSVLFLLLHAYYVTDFMLLTFK